MHQIVLRRRSCPLSVCASQSDRRRRPLLLRVVLFQWPIPAGRARSLVGLMEHKVHFVVAALGRDCDPFTLHIYASFAEQERKLISERCKAVMLALRLQGRKFGVQLRSKSWQRRISTMGLAALTKAADEHAEAHRLHIEWRYASRECTGSLLAFAPRPTD